MYKVTIMLVEKYSEAKPAWFPTVSREGEPRNKQRFDAGRNDCVFESNVIDTMI
jgi:hypothetical protein